MTYNFAGYRALADKLTGRTQKNYLSALAAFEAGLEAKEIWNAEFKDHYSYGFSRALEEIWGKCSDHYGEKYDYTLFGVASINKLNRLADKAGRTGEAAEFLAVVADVPAMIKELKTYIKLGRKPTNPEKVAERLAKEREVRDLLKNPDVLTKEFTAIMNVLKENYRQSRVTYYNKVIDKLAPLVEGKNHWEVRKVFTENNYNIALVPDFYSYPGRFAVIDTKEEIAEAIENASAKDARNAFDGFIFKNVGKLIGIIKNREISMISHTIGGIEGELVVSFTDGAGFRMSFKVEYAVSSRGLHFVRFPTRFHDVMGTNNVPLKGFTSEAKMRKDF